MNGITGKDIDNLASCMSDARRYAELAESARMRMAVLVARLMPEAPLCETLEVYEDLLRAPSDDEEDDNNSLSVEQG